MRILKNFSVIESQQGDYVLSPAYDLLCTALHLDDSDICMKGGLFKGDYNEPAYQEKGMYTRENFIFFALKMEIPLKLAESILREMTMKQAGVFDMLNRSFLSDAGKTAYRKSFTERQQKLLSGIII